MNTQQQLLAALQTGFTTIQVVFPPMNSTVTAEPARTALAAPQLPPLSKSPYRAEREMRVPAWADAMKFHAPVQPATPPAEPVEKSYTYKVLASVGVAVDDFVVVDSPKKGMVVVRVVGVDKAPKFKVLEDGETPITYKWVICKVDFRTYNEQLALEVEFDKTMHELHEEVNRRKDEEKRLRISVLLETEAHKLFPEEDPKREKFDTLLGKLTGSK